MRDEEPWHPPSLHEAMLHQTRRYVAGNPYTDHLSDL